MKIEIWYDIACDKCGSHFSTDFNHGMLTNKKQIKEVAKKEGWKYIRNTNENICPICFKNIIK